MFTEWLPCPVLPCLLTDLNLFMLRNKPGRDLTSAPFMDEKGNRGGTGKPGNLVQLPQLASGGARLLPDTGLGLPVDWRSTDAHPSLGPATC